ncbi:acyl carrier protein [Keratinibaculum paraultunense]|uniref:Acyl carrier protein n=1 Tax=Keratinibaculum paraultunense TaxID=1278232 RepID=A0A4R3KWV3_9FIRM|nr:acyl carrier protein [Keratinibaculum paraultunense]QQY80763.1 acyl carrier protein [Keratinibaculum paraultunense]TCS89626.1 acyl carrier protein [Keratinibaculum paraultunense]
MVYEKIKAMISNQFKIDEDDITMDTSFRKDLKADSIDLVEFIISIEEEFDIEVEDDELENIDTVGDAVKYIEEHIN